MHDAVQCEHRLLVLELAYPGACRDELAHLSYDDAREPMRRALLETVDQRARFAEDPDAAETDSLTWASWLEERGLWEDRYEEMYREAVGLTRMVSAERHAVLVERSEVEL